METTISSCTPCKAVFSGQSDFFWKLEHEKHRDGCFSALAPSSSAASPKSFSEIRGLVRMKPKASFPESQV